MIDKWFETSAEARKLKAHILQYFGPLECVYIERARTYLGVPVMVLLLRPTEKRPYQLLVTIGLSHLKMTVPEQLQGYGLDYAELLMAVPAEWSVDEGNWAVQWLAETAQLAEREKAWLGWGYTSEIKKPTDSDFKGILLMLPDEFDPKAAVCRVNERDDVHFYQVAPLYPEELAFAQANGAAALMERFDGAFSPVVNVRRKNYAVECQNSEV